VRILQVANGYPPTASAGVEIYTATVSRHLAQEHEVFVFSREGGTELPDGSILDEQQDGIRVRRIVNNFRHAHDFSDFHHNAQIDAIFRDYLAEVRPNIIHFQHCIGLSTSMLSTARELAIPHLLSFHDYWFMCPRIQLLDVEGNRCIGPLKGLNCRRCAWWPIESRLLKQPAFRLGEPILTRLPMALGERAARPYTDYVLRHPQENRDLLPLVERAWKIKRLLLEVPLFLTPSVFLRQTYINYGIPAGRIQVLPLGFDLEPWQKQPPRQPHTGRLRLGYIGTLLPHKGVHVLIEAMERLPEELVQLTIYGYGEPDSPYLAELMAHSRPNIRFAGRYDNGQLPQILADVDAIVIPSVWHETFSIVAREALLAEVPVIASDLGALPEIIRDGDTGLLFPAGDSAALGGVIERLASGKVRIDIDSENSAREIWSIERHADELLRLYHQLIGTGVADLAPNNHEPRSTHSS
jgi:glycosyltransferase involved in cell wall biosynthesis